MTLDTRTFIKNDDGTVHQFFRWDGMNLTALRDFYEMYQTAPGATLGAGGGAGVLTFYGPLDQNGEPSESNAVYPGEWVEVAAFASSPNVSGPGTSGYTEIPKPGA